ncbi:MAG: phosphotransferase, partial [Chloroflexota bacterium]
AHRAKHFFAQGGLPIVLPLKDMAQEAIIEYNQTYASLFPFVSGRHLVRGGLSQSALQSMAYRQAQSHRLTIEKTIPDKMPVDRIGQWNRDDVVHRAEAILQQIQQKPVTTPFDKLAQTVLALKLRLISQQALPSKTFDLKPDHLIHGDYHEANLFFDAQDNVSHIFDLEKARLSARLLELVRCVEFTCFSDGSQSGYAYADRNFQAANTYLKQYHAYYPFDLSHLKQAYLVRYWDAVHSLWIEEEHYQHDNQRVDGFLPGTLQKLRYLSKHQNQFIERILRNL